MIVSYHRIANHPTCCHLDVFENQVKLAKKIGAILTFDDGLKEHYTVALPILQKYGVRGYFFVITNSDKQVMASHKIWLLLGHSKDLIKRFNIDGKKFLSPVWYQYDDPKIANLKFYLNTHKKELDEIFHEKFDEQEQIEKLSQWVKLRNIVAHEYLDIRWDSIKRFIEETEPVYKSFLECVRNYLKGKL